MSLQSSHYGCEMLYAVNVEKDRLFISEPPRKALQMTHRVKMRSFKNCKTAIVHENAMLVYFGLCEGSILHMCVFCLTVIMST